MAPAAASATSGLSFASDANGTAVPSSWTAQSPYLYYANPDQSDSATVFYTGATTGDTIKLIDETHSGEVLGTQTAATSGNGSFTFSLATDGVTNSDQIELTDTNAGTSSDGFHIITATSPVLYPSGPVSSNNQPTTDSERLNVADAIPSEPVELYVDGTLESSATQTADANGEATFSLTGLTAGYHTVYAAAEDTSGNPADGSTIGFTTEPVISSTSIYSAYVDTPTPTVRLNGVASDASSINVYEVANPQTGVRTPLTGGTDYTYAVGTGNTATVTFKTALDTSAQYVFTQTDDGAESSPDSISGTSFTVDATAPVVYSYMLVGTVTSDPQPTFYANTNGADGAFDYEFTLTMPNGQTVTSGPVSTQNGWQVPQTLADGKYTVAAVSVDGFGDVGTSASTPLTFTVDTGASTSSTATEPTSKQVTSSLNSALGTLSGKRATVAAILKSDGATLRFTAPSAGTVKIAWYAKIKGKKVLIGSVTKTLGAAGKKSFKVKLDAAGRKLLKGSRGSVKITQSGSFTPKGGKKSTTSRTLKLKG